MLLWGRSAVFLELGFLQPCFKLSPVENVAQGRERVSEVRKEGERREGGREGYIERE